MAEIIKQSAAGNFILEADTENPELVYKHTCPGCPFFKSYCEGMVNYPQGLKTAKLSNKKVTNKQEAESLASKAPC